MTRFEYKKDEKKQDQREEEKEKKVEEHHQAELERTARMHQSIHETIQRTSMMSMGNGNAGSSMMSMSNGNAGVTSGGITSGGGERWAGPTQRNGRVTLRMSEGDDDTSSPFYHGGVTQNVNSGGVAQNVSRRTVTDENDDRKSDEDAATTRARALEEGKADNLVQAQVKILDPDSLEVHDSK
jgi:hypothetical protein